MLASKAWFVRDGRFDDVDAVLFVHVGDNIGPEDAPPIEKNAEIMARFRDRLEELHYDPARFDTYLEQLGIDYPQLEGP